MSTPTPGPGAAHVPGAGTPLAAGRGSVASFDDPRGIGVVRSDEGVDYLFHCTGIADGTRSIAEGAVVTFRVAAGRLGRWEATDIRPDRT